MTESAHPIYTGEPVQYTGHETLYYEDELGENPVKYPIRFKLQKPTDGQGGERDQTGDAANHMRYAHSLSLPQISMRPTPRMGKAILVGGSPSVKGYLEEIRALKTNPENQLFAINWSHTWLINNGIIPDGCVFFEIDAEPDSTLKAAHPGVTYYICSHCHPKTFDELKDFKRVLWHSPPNSEVEKTTGEELFAGSALIGGGIGTMTRTMTIALHLGFRQMELFGTDSSYPDDSRTTHIEGYETTADVQVDSLYVYAKCIGTGEVKRFKTMGYLALQAEEFKAYCQANHQVFALRVHGDGLLRFIHENTWPEQYV